MSSTDGSVDSLLAGDVIFLLNVDWLEVVVESNDTHVITVELFTMSRYVAQKTDFYATTTNLRVVRGTCLFRLG